MNMDITAQPHSSKLAPAISQVHSNNDLDIAPITPLLLFNSPLLPYNNPADDDMYMGDSESNGKKERRDRKALKKREKRRIAKFCHDMNVLLKIKKKHRYCLQDTTIN